MRTATDSTAKYAKYAKYGELRGNGGANGVATEVTEYTEDDTASPWERQRPSMLPFGMTGPFSVASVPSVAMSSPWPFASLSPRLAADLAR